MNKICILPLMKHAISTVTLNYLTSPSFSLLICKEGITSHSLRLVLELVSSIKDMAHSSH